MSVPPGVKLAYDVGERRFYLKKDARVVSIEAKHVRQMLGVPETLNITIGQVKEVAEIIWDEPTRVGGRIERCAEMGDPDRKRGYEPGKLTQEDAAKVMGAVSGVDPGAPAGDQSACRCAHCDLPMSKVTHNTGGSWYYLCLNAACPSCRCSPPFTNPACPVHGFGAKSDDFQGEVGG